MATLVDSGVPAPEWDGRQSIEESMMEEAEYLDRVIAFAGLNGDDEIIGEVIRWQRGDGYAEYVVWDTDPFMLVWLPIGDCWQVEDALIRGLTLADARQMVKQQRALADLFGGG